MHVLSDLGASESPVLHIGNKMDLLSREQRAQLSPIPGQAAKPGQALVSAHTGEGIQELLEAIDRALTTDPIKRVVLQFTQSEGKELSQVYDAGRVLHREDSAAGITVVADLPHSLVLRFGNHVQPPAAASRQVQ